MHCGVIYLRHCSRGPGKLRRVSAHAPIIKAGNGYKLTECAPYRRGKSTSAKTLIFRKTSQYFSSSFCAYRFLFSIQSTQQPCVIHNCHGILYHICTAFSMVNLTILLFRKEPYTKLQKTSSQQRFPSDNYYKLQHIIYNISCERAAYKNPAQLRQSRDCAGINAVLFCLKSLFALKHYPYVRGKEDG